MTVLMAIHQPGYTLLAADRRHTLWGSDGGIVGHIDNDTRELEDSAGGRWREVNRKVSVHPDDRIPVAWAIGGLAELPYRGQQQPVHVLIANAVAEWAERHGTLSSASLTFLAPLVGKTRKKRLDILLGSVAGVAHIQFLNGRPGRVWPIQAACIVPSHNTEAFLGALPEAEKYPPAGLKPKDAAKFVRRLLTRAIAAAHEIAGDNADVGGEIDMVLVDHAGAHHFR